MNIKSIVFYIFTCFAPCFIHGMEPDDKNSETNDNEFQAFYHELNGIYDEQYCIESSNYSNNHDNEEEKSENSNINIQEQIESQSTYRDLLLQFEDRFGIGSSDNNGERRASNTTTQQSSSQQPKRRGNGRSKGQKLKNVDPVPKKRNPKKKITLGIMNTLPKKWTFNADEMKSDSQAFLYELHDKFCCIEDSNAFNKPGYSEILLPIALEMIPQYLDSNDPQVIKRLNDFFILMVKAKWIDLVKYFLESKDVDGKLKFDINYQDSNGNTALIIACILLNTELLDLLLTESPDINRQNNQGDTALTRAVFGGSLDLVEQLFKSETIDLKIKNNDGQSAYSIAYGLNRYKIMNRIRSRLMNK